MERGGDDGAELLWDIINCPLIDPAFDRPSPCSTVVRAQRLTRAQWHIPEPWNGHIDEAPLLFVSSNPSFDPISVYPTRDWQPDDVETYFNDRFTAGEPQYVDRDRALLVNGRYSRGVQYWAEVRTCAAELLNVARSRVHPDVDYALTEVVHCKSRNNGGTAQAAATCAERYLRRIVEKSAARVIVCLGKNVWPHTSRIFGVPAKSNTQPIPSVLGPVEIGERQRLFLFLGQPGSNEPRRPSVAIPNELEGLRRWLRTTTRAHVQRASCEGVPNAESIVDLAGWHAEFVPRPEPEVECISLNEDDVPLVEDDEVHEELAAWHAQHVHSAKADGEK
jgi:hypothetical protein